MCGTSPGSGSMAHWTRPRRQTCDPRTSVGNCRPGRTAPRGCLPYLDPMLGRVCHWHGFHCGFVRPTVRQPGCRKGGFAPLLVSQGFGTAHPDWLAGRSDHQIAIRRPHPLVGRVLAVGEPWRVASSWSARTEADRRAFDEALIHYARPFNLRLLFPKCSNPAVARFFTISLILHRIRISAFRQSAASGVAPSPEPMGTGKMSRNRPFLAPGRSGSAKRGNDLRGE